MRAMIPGTGWTLHKLLIAQFYRLPPTCCVYEGGVIRISRQAVMPELGKRDSANRCE